jgi:hypothetical protein
VRGQLDYYILWMHSLVGNVPDIYGAEAVLVAQPAGHGEHVQQLEQRREILEPEKRQ